VQPDRKDFFKREQGTPEQGTPEQGEQGEQEMDGLFVTSFGKIRDRS